MALSESDRPAPDSDSHSAATVLLAIAELSIILIITHHVF